MSWTFAKDKNSYLDWSNVFQVMYWSNREKNLPLKSLYLLKKTSARQGYFSISFYAKIFQFHFIPKYLNIRFENADTICKIRLSEIFFLFNGVLPSMVPNISFFQLCHFNAAKFLAEYVVIAYNSHCASFREEK